MCIDGTACRGSVRPLVPGQPARPGLPSSAFDVVKANTGQLGDAVVLVTGYSDLVSSPRHNPPDLTPFNTDFEALMSALQAEASVQRVLMLNLRTEDARISGAADQQVQRHQRPPRPSTTPARRYPS